MSKQEASGKRKWVRFAARLALITVAIPAVAAIAGAALNYLTVRHYRALYPAPGQSYSVDGYKMHLYCIGSGVHCLARFPDFTSTSTTLTRQDRQFKA